MFGTARCEPAAACGPAGSPALAGHARPGSASPPSPTRSASPGWPRGRPPPIPTPLAWGAAFDPDLVRTHGHCHRRRHGPAGHPPGAGAGPRRGPRRRAGAGSRSASARTRTWSARSARRTSGACRRGASSRPSSTSSATPASRGGPQPGPGARRPARAQRRPARALRDGAARRRRPLGHALVRRDRRRPGRGRPDPAAPTCCGTAGASTGPLWPTTSGSPSCSACTPWRATSATQPGRRWRPAIDIELPTGNAYLGPLADAVEGGRVPLELVDRAVLRVLRQKEELGLLSEDFADRLRRRGARPRLARAPRHRRADGRAVRRAAVQRRHRSR